MLKTLKCLETALFNSQYSEVSQIKVELKGWLTYNALQLDKVFTYDSGNQPKMK